MLDENTDTIKYYKTKSINFVNPLNAYIDATHRNEMAYDKNPDFFNSTEHRIRVEKVSEILTEFFKRKPNYINKRGIGSYSENPFEVLKISDIIDMFQLISDEKKKTELFDPIKSLGNVKIIFTTRHLLVRVY